MLNSDSNWLQAFFFLEARCYFFCWSPVFVYLLFPIYLTGQKQLIFTTGLVGLLGEVPGISRSSCKKLRCIKQMKPWTKPWSKRRSKTWRAGWTVDSSRTRTWELLGTVGGAKGWRKVWFHMVSPLNQQKRWEDLDVQHYLATICWVLIIMFFDVWPLVQHSRARY